MFHEFGHALHGMFSDVKYPYFFMNVPRDFVEFPSQVNEMWADWPEILANYARHYQTGEPLPQALLDRKMASATFNEGFATTEYLGATIIDQYLHQLPADRLPGAAQVMEYEAQALRQAGLDYAPVPPRYRTPYFSHIMGGYAAAYYAYIWSEVLDANTVEWIKANGGLKRENGDRLRETLLSRGGPGRQAAVRGLHRPRTADRAAAQEARAGRGAVRGLSIRAGRQRDAAGQPRRRLRFRRRQPAPSPWSRHQARRDRPWSGPRPPVSIAPCPRPPHLPSPPRPLPCATGSAATSACSCSPVPAAARRRASPTTATPAATGSAPRPSSASAGRQHDAAYRRYWAQQRGLAAVHGRAAEPRPPCAGGVRAARPVSLLLTQNVDRLHQRAGSRDARPARAPGRGGVPGLQERTSREAVQGRIEAANPGWRMPVWHAPRRWRRGHRRRGHRRRFRAPRCARCDGLLKPDVVFFGRPCRARAWSRRRSCTAPIRCSWPARR